MPGDDPKSSESEGFDFADVPSETGESEETPSKPNRLLPDSVTQDPDVFNLTGPEAADIRGDAAVPPPQRAIPKARAGATREEEVRPEARVDEVWSRGKEWGSTLLLVGTVGLSTLLLVYFALSAGQFGFGFVLLSIGAIACIILSYPMVITLERPVRMTPEQAIRDYYAALSHHRPHFRRMWLLLSTNGRSSSRFGSYEGFVQCWRSWLLDLRGQDASTWTPLHFEIEGVKAEKSPGRTAVRVDYTIRVFVRGHRDEAPVASFSVRHWTVRGPDGMWYLDDGNPPSSELNPRQNRKESASE